MKRVLGFFLHGFLLAGVSPVVVYLVNPDARLYVAPWEISRPVLIALVLYVLLALLGFLLTRDPRPAGLIASVLTLGFLYLWPFALLLSLLALSALGLLRVLRKKQLDYRTVHAVSNVLAAAVTGYYLVVFGAFLARQPWTSYRSTVGPIVPAGLGHQADSSSLDIYYIILDGYARADVLSGIYGYDNTDFVEALEGRGFFVAPGAQANYPRTVLSLASSLNMQYLDGMSSALGESELWWPVEGTLHHSQIRSLLEAAGYRTVFASSGFDYTDLRDGDLYLHPYPVMLNDFEEMFFRYTNLSAFQGLGRPWISFLSVEAQRRVVLHGFSALAESARLPGPKFEFVHIIAPHPPFVFDAQGNLPENRLETTFLGDANEFQGDPSQYRAGYLAQLEFVNREILAAIDEILGGSASPPIIVIQGDHGPGLYTDYDSAGATCLWERYSILSAYYLPGIDPAAIPPDISPVNSFRLILDAYFGQSLEMLPNQYYFSGRTHFYQFEDVTGQTEARCAEPEPAAP